MSEAQGKTITAREALTMLKQDSDKLWGHVYALKGQVINVTDSVEQLAEKQSNDRGHILDAINSIMNSIRLLAVRIEALENAEEIL